MPEAGQPVEVLELSGVLLEALPAELSSATAPARYMVPAVFARRPLPREVAILEGPEAHARLSTAGYSAVSLKVVDRRLEIGGTSLGELERGLATLLATMLRDATVAVAAADPQRPDRMRTADEDELHRSEEVGERAGRIVFSPDEQPILPLDTVAP